MVWEYSRWFVLANACRWVIAGFIPEFDGVAFILCGDQGGLLNVLNAKELNPL